MWMHLPGKRGDCGAAGGNGVLYFIVQVVLRDSRFGLYEWQCLYCGVYMRVLCHLHSCVCL